MLPYFTSGLLLAVLLWMQPIYGQIQVRVKDQVDLRPLEGVKLSFKDESGSLIDSGRTDYKGLFSSQNLSLKRAKTLEVSHPAFTFRKITREVLQAQGYQVFLQSKSYNFDEVVFTANKYQENREDIPYQIDVIKNQDIQLQNPQTTADLLATSGNVFIQKSQQGGGSPSLRGFEANKVLIVIDGVRMNNAIYRAGHLQNVITIDPSIIDRTEVMLGPSSVMYGSDALGGVMHFYTRPPELSPKPGLLVKGGGYSRYGSANRSKTLHGELNLGTQKWGSLTAFSVNQFGDLRTGNWRPGDYPEFGIQDFYVDQINGRDTVLQNPQPNRLRPSGYGQMDLTQKFLFVPNRRLSHALNFQYSTTTNIPRYDRYSLVVDGSPRFAEWDYGPQKRLLTSYQFRHIGDHKLYDQLTAIAAYQQIQESRLTRNFGSSHRQHRIEDLNIVSLNVDANKVVQYTHELAYGLEGFSNFLQSTAFAQPLNQIEQLPLDTRYPDGGSQYTSLAAYFTHRWEINDQWQLTDGLRINQVNLSSRFVDRSFYPFPFDEIQQNNTALSGNLGIVFQPGDGWRFSLLGATGFRAPNVDDVAKVFDSQPPNVVVPNPNLKPEYTYNGELSISKRWGDLFRISVTGFATRYTNAIVVRDFTFNDQDSIPYNGVLSKVQANVNAKEAFIAGVSTQAQLNLGSWHLYHTLTYTYGQELETDVPMDHIPPLFGRGGVKYEIKQLVAEAYVSYQGWKHLNRFSPRDFNNLEFATEDGWPAWWTANLKASYTLNRWIKFQAGVENLFDLHYRPFSSRISAPGRNVYLTTRISF
ncbi:MAG: TonB-dependent receptor [Bacteroidota bacterium]